MPFYQSIISDYSSHTLSLATSPEFYSSLTATKLKEAKRKLKYKPHLKKYVVTELIYFYEKREDKSESRFNSAPTMH